MSRTSLRAQRGVYLNNSSFFITLTLIPLTLLSFVFSISNHDEMLTDLHMRLVFGAPDCVFSASCDEKCWVLITFSTLTGIGKKHIPWALLGKNSGLIFNGLHHFNHWSGNWPVTWFRMAFLNYSSVQDRCGPVLMMKHVSQCVWV